MLPKGEEVWGGPRRDRRSGCGRCRPPRRSSGPIPRSRTASRSSPSARSAWPPSTLETGEGLWVVSVDGTAGTSVPLPLADGDVAYAGSGLTRYDGRTGDVVWALGGDFARLGGVRARSRRTTGLRLRAADRLRRHLSELRADRRRRGGPAHRRRPVDGTSSRPARSGSAPPRAPGVVVAVDAASLGDGARRPDRRGPVDLPDGVGGRRDAGRLRRRRPPRRARPGRGPAPAQLPGRHPRRWRPGGSWAPTSPRPPTTSRSPPWAPVPTASCWCPPPRRSARTSRCWR